MKAVILVGGMGTRLRPVTYEIPKPLLPVRKKPIINHLLELFFRHGVDEAALLASASHEEDFRRWKKTWDDVLPMDKVKIVYEDKPRGTFGGMLLLKDWLGKEPFIVSNGDELKDFDIPALLKFHDEQGAVGTLALVEVSEPQHYGVPIIEGGAEKGKVSEIFEKPENPPSTFVSSGFYVFDPEVFEHVPPGAEYVMTEIHINPKLAKEGKLSAMRMKDGRWYDCGTLERWEKAMNEW